MRCKLRVAVSGDFPYTVGNLTLQDIGLDVFDAAVGSINYRVLPSKPESEEVQSVDLHGTDALLLRGQYLTARSLSPEVAQTLAVVGRAGAGYDKIDVPACTRADVLVFYVPDALTEGTASGALALLLAVTKQLCIHDRLVRTGRWDDRSHYHGVELYRKTLGVIGPGRIGGELVRLVAPFQMRVLAYSHRLTPERARAKGAQCVPLDVLLEQSDFVCITCPLTNETRGMIGTREIALMKRTAYLVNVARGPIIDQRALTEALRSGRIAGAALDVFDREPLPPNDPLTHSDNALLNPHFVCSTVDLLRYTNGTACAGLVQFARGDMPLDVINPEVLSQPGFRKKRARFDGRDAPCA